MAGRSGRCGRISNIDGISRLADQIGMDAFVVVVTAGFGSLKGAFIVSIIFGLLNAYGVQFVSQLAPVLMFSFMAIVLAFKPMGFFGEIES